MPPDLIDLALGRCGECWLPRPHSTAEHFDYAERVTVADLGDYALAPRVEETLTG